MNKVDEDNCSFNWQLLLPEEPIAMHLIMAITSFLQGAGLEDITIFTVDNTKGCLVRHDITDDAYITMDDKKELSLYSKGIKYEEFTKETIVGLFSQ